MGEVQGGGWRVAREGGVQGGGGVGGVPGKGGSGWGLEGCQERVQGVNNTHCN